MNMIKIISLLALLGVMPYVQGMDQRDDGPGWRTAVTVTGIGVGAVVGLVELARHYYHEWAVKCAQNLLVQDREYVAKATQEFTFDPQQSLDSQLQAIRDYAVATCYAQDVTFPLAKFVELLRSDIDGLEQIARRRAAVVDEATAVWWCAEDRQVFGDQLQALIAKRKKLLVALNASPAYVTEREAARRYMQEVRAADDQHEQTQEQTRLVQEQRRNAEMQNRLTAAKAREASAKAAEQERKTYNAYADDAHRAQQSGS